MQRQAYRLLRQISPCCDLEHTTIDRIPATRSWLRRGADDASLLAARPTRQERLALLARTSTANPLDTH
jgi:hypothetical protein